MSEVNQHPYSQEFLSRRTKSLEALLALHKDIVRQLQAGPSKTASTVQRVKALLG